MERERKRKYINIPHNLSQKLFRGFVDTFVPKEQHQDQKPIRSLLQPDQDLRMQTKQPASQTQEKEID